MPKAPSQESAQERSPLPQSPRILVSACLAGEACRYDGRDNAVAEIVALHRQGLALPVCPEVLGGLPIPRTPCERQGERVVAKDGTDCTQAFLLGARKALSMAKEAGVTVAILKARSPSCGLGRIYDGTFTHTLCQGNGVFVDMLLKEGVQVVTEENCADFLQTFARNTADRTQTQSAKDL